MIAIRIFSSAVATALSLLLGAATAHAYITPDEFIQGGGQTVPEDNAGDIGNVPLPILGEPPAQNTSSSSSSSSASSPASQPTEVKPPVQAPSRKGGGAAPVLPLLDAGEVVPQAQWESREEERRALRGTHGAAPESGAIPHDDIPHTAATLLAPSGLPLTVPFLMSALGVGGITFLKKKNGKRS